jgi:nucleoside-triphosphatase THEP1
MKRAYLLSGEPGSGKTTIIKKVLAKVGKSAGGFYTEEIRSQGIRQGFQIVTLDGQVAVMAHSGMSSPYRVGKYGVDTGSIDGVAVPAIREAMLSYDIVVIDEIGRMELFSPYFRDAVIEALESEKKVLGTVMLAAHPWADEIKRRDEVEIVRVTRANRNEVVDQVLLWLES